MASRSLQYVCRDCRRALKSSNLSHTRSTISPATRNFTSTTSQLKTLATFTPTDRPVLDELFSRWRSDVFLPSVISTHHQALIYQKKRAEILTTAPGVSVTVETFLPPSVKAEQDEETIKLEPKVAWNQPKQSESFKTILTELKKSGSAQTWENIIPFLHGCQQARRTVTFRFHEALARVANDRNDGRWNTMMTAAVQSKKTGVTLAEMPFTTELVVGLHDRAARAKYSLDVASRKLLTQLIVTMEDKDHCGSDHWKDMGPLYQDMRTSPVVLGTQLAFSASRALQEKTNKHEYVGKVSRDVRKLLAVLESSDGSISKEVADELLSTTTPRFREQMINIREYEARIVVLAGLRLAQKVDMSAVLDKSEKVTLHHTLTKSIDLLQNKIELVQKDFESSKNPPARSLAMQKHIKEAVTQLQFS